MFFSSGVIIFLVSKPPMTLSVASSKHVKLIFFRFFLAATMAASLQMFSMSAPEKPGVKPAKRPLYSEISFSNFKFLKWTSKICFLPMISGKSMVICRSNLPGLNKAGSNVSARFVPAKITTFTLSSNPSISTNNWLRVLSLSSLLPANLPPPRFLPTASISSMKTMQGALLRASLNKSLTRLAPTPTNISMKSEPEIEKNGTFASPAVAFASKVFPVPGGPLNKAPFGIFAPNSVNFLGFLRNSTNSMISFLA
mmetsp:Transcript_20365/g.30125  ORF Transcript_20365/g.30125 Transcript_20365/m.30125 type:complete len:254 (-) Transcript_20365:641-1402(-)